MDAKLLGPQLRAPALGVRLSSLAQIAQPCSLIERLTQSDRETDLNREALRRAPVYFDELLDDMGATERRRNPLAEKFTPPDADAYARFLASAPDYKVFAS